MAEWLYWQNESSIRAIVRAVQESKVVLGDSDTVLGLLAPCTQQGFHTLNEIKRRTGKPYLILMSSIDKIAHFANPDDIRHIEKLMYACWPGPLTIIVPAKPDLPSYLMSDDNTVALRVPNHQGLLRVLEHFDGLFSTSANITDEPIPIDIEQVNPLIVHAVDIVIRDKHAEPHNVVPSTIIDATGDTLRVIREGAFSQEQIERLLSM